MRVLGIETSCDETSIAIYDEYQGLMAHQIHSQVLLHAKYGGIVPELASRDHVQQLIPLLKLTLKEANITTSSIQGIAYTQGPGLVGALLVGSTFAKALSYAWQIPILGIHHMEGHLLAALLDKPALQFPFIALLISGGHSLLIKVQKLGDYKVLGDTLDDAVGEAFDKTAKLLHMTYPGGPEIEKLAKQGNPERYKFPRPLTEIQNLDFSFSGLKTFASNTFKNSKQDDYTKADIARAFQDAVIETLSIKCQWALSQTKLTRVIVAGGVCANQTLRLALKKTIELQNATIYYPRPELCTDNGAMIAYAGFLRLKQGQRDLDLKVRVFPRWSISDLKSIDNLVND